MKLSLLIASIAFSAGVHGGPPVYPIAPAVVPAPSPVVPVPSPVVPTATAAPASVVPHLRRIHSELPGCVPLVSQGHLHCLVRR